MGFLFSAFAGFLLSAAGTSGTGDGRAAEPADLVLERAEAEAALKSGILQSAIAETHEFDVDLDTGVIRFVGETKVVSAPVQVVGTYNTLDGTFLWGWDHPSVSKPLAADARLVRAFGRRQGLSLLTTRKVECSEDEAWMFTAVAAYLSGAQGTYRAPYGTTMVFLTLGELSIVPLD